MKDNEDQVLKILQDTAHRRHCLTTTSESCVFIHLDGKGLRMLPHSALKKRVT